MTKQLSLPVNLRDTETFDSFVVGNNQQLVSMLIGLTEQANNIPDTPWLTFISGDTGVGKSHLLYALCQQAQNKGLSCVYLNFNDQESFSLEMLEDLEHSQVICLDDIDALQGSKAWQIGVFDLINRIKENGTSRLVITANASPNNLQLELADLISRLAWGISYKLNALNDEQRSEALIKRAEQRGLSMPKKVATYLVNHWRRDMPALMTTLDKLDVISLQEQRKLTIPFVKTTLDL
ncbi:MAG: DnaA family protein [Paraglaciecola sp.]|jgi:DnaA family protein